MELDVHATALAVCRLPADTELPAWIDLAVRPLVSITRTRDELSVVTAQDVVPPGVTVETDWRAMSVRGPLPFDLTGVLAALAVPLADARVPIFVISTFDTDWLLVRGPSLIEATTALEAAGHRVHASG